jgi:hypothetical protein
MIFETPRNSVSALENTNDSDSDSEDDDHTSETGRDDDGYESDGQHLQAALNSKQLKLDEAKDHIRKYQTQRKLANDLIAQSRADIASAVPFASRRHCLTIDMGQNLALPNFAGDQP